MIGIPHLPIIDYSFPIKIHLHIIGIVYVFFCFPGCLSLLVSLVEYAFSQDDVLKLLPSPPKTARIQTAITDLQAGSTGVPDSIDTYIYIYSRIYIYI